VIVEDSQGQQWDGYSALIITGSRTESDPDRARKTEVQYPHGASGLVKLGLYFFEDQWNGEDIFWVDRSIVVTERLRTAMTRHRISNVTFTSLSEFELPLEIDEQ
jgi:hypothetical protein